MNNLRKLVSAEQLNYKMNVQFKEDVLLVPVICIDAERMVLEGLLAFRMQGYANYDAVAITLESGLATFYSRERDCIWTKGEQSGNTLIVRAAYTDCDQDSLLLDVNAIGPTCHLNTETCFSLPTIGE